MKYTNFILSTAQLFKDSAFNLSIPISDDCPDIAGNEWEICCYKGSYENC